MNLAWLLFVLVLNMPLAAAAAAEQQPEDTFAPRGVALDSPRACGCWVAAEHYQRGMAAGAGYHWLIVDGPDAFVAFGLAGDKWQTCSWRCDPHLCASAWMCV